MADGSKIQWTEATWNWVTGCESVSDGCTNCYARTLINTRQMVNPRSQRFGHPFSEVMLHPERLEYPLRWKRTRRIFVNSLSDVWHRDVPVEMIDRAFDVMERASWHTFQILTKRSEWMRRYLNNRYPDKPCPSHIHVGVSVESNDVKWRVKDLVRSNVSIAWISAEPLLGSLNDVLLDGVRWVVVGGESGPGARPMHPQWARDIRESCLKADIAFFYKQTGAWAPREWKGDGATHALAFDGEFVELGHHPNSGERAAHAPDGGRGWQGIALVGKHAAGRLLDGREWNEYPKALVTA